MSTRFFQSVRRNQKQWMVVVTVLSMVSFLFLDDFAKGKGPVSSFGGALMIGSLAAGMCIVGYPRQKTVEFGIGGFVAGFLAGFIGFGSLSGNKPIVRTSLGSMTRADLDAKIRDRHRLNTFLRAIGQKAELGQGLPFVALDDHSTVRDQLRVAEAKKMGIQVTDERVNEFIEQLTRGKVSDQDYRDCLRESRLGEGELFELLKSEIAAQMVVNLTEPPGYVPPLPSYMEMGLAQYKHQLWYMQETPDQLWGIYEKLHLKESLLAVAIPVKDFVTKVAEPTDGELLAFFDKHKFAVWTDEARPGFTLTPRVQLAYLTGDIQDFEKGTEPTAAEVQAYYNKNKEHFPVHKAKESTAPNLPDEPADALNPERPADAAAKSFDLDNPKESDAKINEEADGDAKKPAAETPDSDQTEKQKNSDKPQDAKPTDEPKSSCGEQGTDEKPTAEDLKEAKSAPKDEKPDEGTAPEPRAETDKKPVDEKLGKDEEKWNLSLPKLSKTPSDVPVPKYQELDDDLKLRIREIIVNDRAYERLTAALDKAREFMADLGLEYEAVTNAEKKKEMAKTIADQLMAYAIEHKLEYQQLPELTQEVLSAERIGRASDTRDQANVVQEVFTPGQRGESRLPNYSPRRADLKIVHAAYAYWKIGELPMRIADLKDEKVRQDAISAWKFDKARPLAEERAKELTKKVEQTDKSEFQFALSGESVTGAKDGRQVSFISTIEFSWLTMNQTFPGARGGPKITTIPLINDIGDDFMKTVFDDLDNGQTGVAVDIPKAVYYVVKVVDRQTPGDDDGGLAKREWHQRFMKEEFTSEFYPAVQSPYQSLARIPQQQIDMASARRAAEQFRMDWEENTSNRKRQ